MHVGGDSFEILSASGRILEYFKLSVKILNNHIVLIHVLVRSVSNIPPKLKTKQDLNDKFLL